MKSKVSRIQTHATILLNADQKESIVPNKAFITSQFINWSLSDSITRIVVPIVIAHGVDVELAHKVMMDVVKSTQLVLEEPAPSVVFTGFGENGLEYPVRCTSANWRIGCK